LKPSPETLARIDAMTDASALAALLLSATTLPDADALFEA